MEKQLGVAVPRRTTHTYRTFRVTLACLAILMLFLLGNFDFQTSFNGSKLSVVARVQNCAIDNFHQNTSFLDLAKSISADEFVERQDRLAQALAASDVDAFVFEPGYTFQYAVQSLRSFPN